LLTDEARTYSAKLSGVADLEASTWTTSYALDSTLQIGGRLRLGSRVGWTQWFGRHRWVDTGTDGLPLFGALKMEQLEAVLRGTVVFTRNFTFQLFGQLLLAGLRYPNLFELVNPFTENPCDQGTSCASAVAPGTYDQSLTSLIVNGILRWEFMPGSTVY